MWSDKLKNAPTRSLDWWIFTAACNVVCRVAEEMQHEETCRAIGKIAFETNTNIWHASWVYHGQIEKCYCTPCNRRK